MKKTIRRLLYDWIPPAVIKQASKINRKHTNFEGNYSSWQDAAYKCSGYDGDNIIEKVLSATLNVKNGGSAFERDSVNFETIEYSWPLTSALMWAAAKDSGRLNVLDFGGSLGSSYFQNRKFLNDLLEVKWNVIEQPHYVEQGKKHIEDDTLKFYSNIRDCLSENTPNVILLSGVLQYVPTPFDILKELGISGVRNLIIDRTSYSDLSDTAFLKIQHVPEQIYTASYPCWFFNESYLVNKILDMGFSLLEDFDALDDLDDGSYWKGHIYYR